MVNERNFQRYVSGGLAAAVLILAIGVVSQDQAVILPPPSWEGNAEIARNAANANYKKGWALGLAQFLGNITPSNVDFVVENVGNFFAPDVYNRIRTALQAQSESIKNDGLTVTFASRAITYEPETDKVFVNGYTKTEGRDGRSETVERTYEFKISIVNYMPTTTWFDLYRGPPRTKAHLAAMGGGADDQ